MSEPFIPRTVTDAKAQLEAITPQLNPAMYDQISKEVREAERDATGHAERYAHDRYLEQHAAGVQVQQEACAVRDEATALLARIQSGQMTARDGHVAMSKLVARQRTVAGRAQRIATATDSIERVEADPIGFYDRIVPADRRRTFTF